MTFAQPYDTGVSRGMRAVTILLPPRHRGQLGLLLATGAVDRAQGEIEEAVRIRPGLAEAHRDLADILAAKGRSREAAAEYRLAEQGGRQ